jgi:hypothetical protein
MPILIFYIDPCWEYLPVSGAGPSPCCYRKIPQEPQIKNVRKNCRRRGEVKDLDIFTIFFIDKRLFCIDYFLFFID